MPKKWAKRIGLAYRFARIFHLFGRTHDFPDEFF